MLNLGVGNTLEDEKLKKKFLLVVTALTLAFSLTACGEDPELAKFKTEMENFCQAIAEIDEGMNNIDVTAEGYREELLEYLDKAEDEFRKLGSISIPEEFAYIEELVQGASEDMITAVEQFHEAFGVDSYNEYTFEYANEYYQRAYKRLTYIITLLHGEIPEDDDIKIYE